MAEIPRKPTFPDHIIRKILTRIEQEVQDNVIPVSAGIYSEQKLINQLQAIPKPLIVDYDDRIFYELHEKQNVCTLTACPTCHQEYNNRKKPIMCHFCTKWSCEDCICHRQRLHPLEKNPNGKRYSICYDCDGKYLSLLLNHSYVENRMLIQTAIVEVSKDLEAVQLKLDGQRRKIDAIKGEPKRKLNMKVSILKKEDLDLKKNLKKVNWDIENERDRASKLQQKLCDARLKHQKEKEAQEKLKLKKETQRIEQQRKKAEQERRREEEQRRRVEEEKERQRIRRQEEEKERIQKERQNERLKKMELQMQKEKQAQKRKQKQKELQIERQKQKQRLKQLEKKKQLQKQKQLERQKQLQRQREVQRLQKLEQQRRHRQEQEQRLARERQQALKREKEDNYNQYGNDEAEDVRNAKANRETISLIYRPPQLPPNSPVSPGHQQNENWHQLHDSHEIQFTFDPSKNEQTHDTEHEPSRNSYLFHQFKNYFTEQILSNAQKPEQPQISMNKMTHPSQNLERSLSHEEKQELFSKFRKSLEEEEEKANEGPEIQSAKMEIMKEANLKRRNWEDLNKEEGEQPVVAAGQKCKCSIF